MPASPSDHDCAAERRGAEMSVDRPVMRGRKVLRVTVLGMVLTTGASCLVFGFEVLAYGSSTVDNKEIQTVAVFWATHRVLNWWKRVNKRCGGWRFSHCVRTRLRASSVWGTRGAGGSCRWRTTWRWRRRGPRRLRPPMIPLGFFDVPSFDHLASQVAEFRSLQRAIEDASLAGRRQAHRSPAPC